MPKFLNPAIAAAIAAALAGTTGYCVLTYGDPPGPPPAPAPAPTERTLPEAIVPYPIPLIEDSDVSR